jgi:uncharacterized protein (UPF0335 family)
MDAVTPTTHTSGIAADRLRSLVERVERLTEEKRAIAADIKDIFQEAKSAGFNVSVLRQLIKDRAKDAADLEEFETLLDVYKRALGEFVSTPLGQAGASNLVAMRA